MKTDCCCSPLTHPAACSCYEGIEALTPLPTANRPGLTALSYRVGTHATFLETMKAKLSGSQYSKLAELTSREPDDPALALLDAWATVADVLTFYQERIANEGYLRTATERRSVLELARLVGYQPRPGVASSAYLAYTLDNNFKEEVTIPKGARSQSIPGPGELPQSFETSEDLKARAQWNNLKPRMTQLQTLASIKTGIKLSDEAYQRIYLKGISTNLKPNDPLLIDFGDSDQPEFFRVKKVLPDAAANRTLVILQKKSTVTSESMDLTHSNKDLIGELALPPAPQLANSLQLSRDLKRLFGGSGVAKTTSSQLGVNVTEDTSPEILIRKSMVVGEASHTALKVLAPVLQETLAIAAKNADVTKKNMIKAYALRVKASLFGHNAPKEPQYEPAILENGEFAAPNPNAGNLKPQKDWPEWGLADDETGNRLFLDNEYKTIAPDSYIAIQYPNDFGFTSYKVEAFKIADAVIRSRNAYGLSISTTEISLSNEQTWWTPQSEEPDDVTMFIRGTTVYAQSEELELAEESIEDHICGGTDQLIELDGLYEGLESGRWVIVSGERNIPGTSGVRFSELAMLATVTQNVQLRNDIPLAGDKIHSFIRLATKLAYCFKRDTVRIYGNVVKAIHGETRKEVLGSGDGTKAFQSFGLKQPPLTYVAAANPSGVDGTLKVYINDIQWHETGTLAGISSTAHNFITKTDDEGKTTVIFGNGREGARLPTGVENIRAEYRNGIGKAGNVKAEQISLLTTRPLGVKEVINPLRASGGADKETRDQARRNAPLAVKALDRLVSVQDYEDFARVFAGIGKARAVELSDGRRQLVHITIAGVDDIPIDNNSDLYRNLRQALSYFGDPYQAIQLEIRELMFIVISAGIRILLDYQWEPVVTAVRSALLDAFSFDRRELGQDVMLSEVISVMQAVRGVAFVDVDILRGIPEKIPDIQTPGQRRLLTPAEIADKVSGSLKEDSSKPLKEPLARIAVNLANNQSGTILPAQLAYLTPEVPETLILNQIS